MVLQDDHNLVMYDQRNEPIWSTHTNGKGRESTFLKMQDDGNLVLYDKFGTVWIGVNLLIKIYLNLIYIILY